MKEVVKNYNFCNFNFKATEKNISKNVLSIDEVYNLSCNNSTISSVCGFENFLQSIFSSSNYELFLENYSNFINSIIFITDYEYLIDGQKVCDYFIIDNNFNLFKLSFLDNSFLIADLNVQFATMPKIYKNNAKIYFYSKNDIFIYFDTNICVTVSDFYELYTICDYLDETFFVSENDKFQVYFDEKNSIENLGNNLSVYDSFSVNPNDGEIIKLVKFKNNLYVIQQYAISKIVKQNDKYYLYSNCFIQSKILENSIGEFNDYLIFYSSSGLYVFDGNETKLIFESITKKIDYCHTFKSLVFNEKYYILASTKINNEYKNAIFEFNIQNFTTKIYYYENIVDIYVIKSTSKYNLIAVVQNDSNYVVMKMNEKIISQNFKYIKFNKICFDDNISKSIIGIKTISTGNFFIKIITENDERIFDVSNNFDFSSFSLSGYAFDIEIYGNNDFEIFSLIFIIQTLSEQI